MLSNIISISWAALVSLFSYPASPATTFSQLPFKERLTFPFKTIHRPRLPWSRLFPAVPGSCLGLVEQACWWCVLISSWWLSTFSWHLFIPAFKSLGKILIKTRLNPALLGSALRPPPFPLLGAGSVFLYHYLLFMTSQPASEFMWPRSFPRQSGLALEEKWHARLNKILYPSSKSFTKDLAFLDFSLFTVSWTHFFP